MVVPSGTYLFGNAWSLCVPFGFFPFLMFQGTSRHGNSHIDLARKHQFRSWTLPGCTQFAFIFLLTTTTGIIHLCESFNLKATLQHVAHGRIPKSMNLGLQCSMPIYEMRPWCIFCCPPLFMVQYVVAMLWYSLRTKADIETKNLHLHLLMQSCLFIYSDFWLITPSSKKEMLIIFKPDPSRCIDCCIHLYLFYFSKRLRHHQNWGFAPFW